MAPENGWLEYDPFLLGWPILRCKLLGFREGRNPSITAWKYASCKLLGTFPVYPSSPLVVRGIFVFFFFFFFFGKNIKLFLGIVLPRIIFQSLLCEVFLCEFELRKAQNTR